ncbi:hypothetical protein Lal_00003831 [Lupinus albus]|nr:hypothetical protein Lal_00003831 [Lupinus albus]
MRKHPKVGGVSVELARLTKTKLNAHQASRHLIIPLQNSPAGSSYPEGNFGGNQLLDGSISLSPLYPSQTNDLHVSIAAGIHQSELVFKEWRGFVGWFMKTPRT